jgi:hypothetical protein
MPAAQYITLHTKMELEKMKNKLYTKSYFIKRLRESGMNAHVMFDKYSPGGRRYWTIMVDPGRSDIMITCMKSSAEDYSFTVQTENITNYTMITQSMQVMTDFLSKIINKPVIAGEGNAQ